MESTYRTTGPTQGKGKRPADADSVIEKLGFRSTGNGQRTNSKQECIQAFFHHTTGDQSSSKVSSPEPRGPLKEEGLLGQFPLDREIFNAMRTLLNGGQRPTLYFNLQSGQVSKQYAKNFPEEIAKRKADDLVLPLHFSDCGSEESHIDVLRTLTTPKEMIDGENKKNKKTRPQSAFLMLCFFCVPIPFISLSLVL
uniref:UBX domain-containing protein n=1 Tax=Steinernema glaseri TaxID=37863 RepID=A0A1I8ACR4_9BILA